MKDKIRLLFTHFLYNTTLKTKLFTVTFTAAIIPTVIICIVSLNKMVNIQLSATNELAALSLEHAEQVLSSYLDQAVQTANLVLLDDTVQETLQKDPLHYPQTLQVPDFQNLTSVLQTIQHEQSMESIRITLDDSLLFSHEGYNYIPFSQLQELLKLPGSDEIITRTSYWSLDQIKTRFSSAPATPVLSYVKLIRSKQNFEDILGYVCVDLPIDKIKILLKKASLSDDSLVYAFDINGSASVSYGPDILPGDILAAVRSLSPDGGSFQLDTSEYIYQSVVLPEYNWKIVTFLPVTYLSRQREEGFFAILSVTVILGIITLGIIYTFYRCNLYRIQTIVAGIQEIQNGDLETRLTVCGTDEYSTIEGNFNYMAERITALIEETLILNDNLKKAEFKALQAQINPHFLYNAINTISWTALDCGADKVSSMLESLAAFYKINLKISRHEVTLSEELELVRRYIEIENMRYMNRITLETSLSRDMLATKIPNMSLQPIVENSILHGILPKGQECGTITVSGYKTDSFVYLSITDNGIGFDPDTLAHISEPAFQSQSYGLFSINERLKLRFGAQYGLSFRNGENGGAVITLTLPVDF